MPLCLNPQSRPGHSAACVGWLPKRSCSQRTACSAPSPPNPTPPHPPFHTPRTPHTSPERCSRELAARLELVGKVEREVGKARALMEGVETEIGRKKEVSRKVRRAGKHWAGMHKRVPGQAQPSAAPPGALAAGLRCACSWHADLRPPNGSLVATSSPSCAKSACGQKQEKAVRVFQPPTYRHAAPHPCRSRRCRRRSRRRSTRRSSWRRSTST